MSYTVFINYKSEGGANTIDFRRPVDSDRIHLEVTEFIGISTPVVQVSLTVEDLWDLRNRIGDLLFEMGEAG